MKTDTVRPVVRLTLPKRRLTYVATWKTLKGRATDTAGTGVARVEVKAVQKRGTAWYAFKPTTRTWVKTTTKARAFVKAGVRKVVPTATGTWTAALPRLRKGTLVYKVVAVDKASNRSATVVAPAASEPPLRPGYGWVIPSTSRAASSCSSVSVPSSTRPIASTVSRIVVPSAIAFLAMAAAFS